MSAPSRSSPVLPQRGPLRVDTVRATLPFLRFFFVTCQGASEAKRSADEPCAGDGATPQHIPPRRGPVWGEVISAMADFCPSPRSAAVGRQPVQGRKVTLRRE